MKGKTAFFFSILLFCMAASFIGYGNDEAAAATCTGGALPAGSGENVVVSGTCTVGAGIYRYGNVNIIAGGTLKFIESPNAGTHFWAKSILVEYNGSLIAGTPAAPIGTQNGTLTIHLYGADTDKAGIQCQSPVVSGAPCGIPPAVWNPNPPPTSTTCTKTVFPSGVNDCFYPYMPPDNIAGETGLFGRKVLAVSYGGTLQLFGRKGATYTNGVQNWDSGKSWVRLRNQNSRPGENIFYLDRAVDWKQGDRVVVTTTDYLPGHSEEFEIITVDPNQPKITAGRIDPLTNQLPPACAGASPPAACNAQYAHNGDLYLLDNLPDRLKINATITNGGMDNGTAAAETRAAVALLTRSIRIVSGGNTIPATQAGMTCRYNCFPVSDGFYGGHTLVLEGFKDYRVQGVEFYQLGQGGRKARYPVHFHLARKTPAATFVKDCSVHDSMTRWYTLHGTQGVTLARNVGYLSIGHGYYLEDGTETDNKFYSNIGIFARAAISNGQNPRKVPGILAGGSKVSADPPYNSDF
ncbi:MAG: G8 domain-containing protein, partial [Syntrophobacteraceae bacterium]